MIRKENLQQAKLNAFHLTVHQQKWSLFYLVLISLLILNACNIPFESPPTPVPGLANTLAVQTMAARPDMAGLFSTPSLSPTPSFTNPAADALHSTVTPLPTDSPVPSITPFPSATQPLIGPDGTEIPCNAAKFVRDVTFPDDSIVKPRRTFTKTWEIMNVGACTWTPEYNVVFIWGAKMDGISPMPLTDNVKPGETVELSMKFVAPEVGNCYQGNWMLEDPQGNRFGVGYKAAEFFWIAVTVWQPGMSKLVR